MYIAKHILFHAACKEPYNRNRKTNFFLIRRLHPYTNYLRIIVGSLRSALRFASRIRESEYYRSLRIFSHLLQNVFVERATDSRTTSNDNDH